MTSRTRRSAGRGGEEREDGVGRPLQRAKADAVYVCAGDQVFTAAKTIAVAMQAASATWLVERWLEHRVDGSVHFAV